MTHASVELIAALAGEAPWADRVMSKADNSWANAACRDSDNVSIDYACFGHAASRDTWDLGICRVDCPECLLAMRSAIDPVRYDYLHERGLVP